MVNRDFKSLYWNVPLVEALSSPVIELPKLGVSEGTPSHEVKDMFGQTVQTDLFGNELVGRKSEKNDIVGVI